MDELINKLDQVYLMRTHRPIGWRGDSYRHSLSSRGISSSQKLYSKKYFATDFAPQSYDALTASEPNPSRVSDMLKGNRTDPPNVKRLRTKKWTDDAILENANSLMSQVNEQTGEPLLTPEDVTYIQEKVSKRQSSIPVAPPTSEIATAPIELPEFITPDLPSSQTPTMKVAPTVDLDNLEDELPDRRIALPSTLQPLSDESLQGTPAGLRRQQQIMSTSVMTPGAPEAIPDYDLRT